MRPDESAASPATVRRAPPVPRNAWAWLLAVGLVGAAGYLLIGDDHLQNVVYQLYGVAAVLAIVLGVRRYRPANPRPWYLMALGLGIWSVADGIGSIDKDLLGNDRFPSPADPVYLVGYLVIGVSLLLLIRSRGRAGDVGGLLDSAIFTVSMATLVWVLVAGPTVGSYEQAPVAAAVAAAYPLFDIILAGLLIRLVTTPGGKTRSFRLLAYAVVALVLADTLATALDMTSVAASELLEPLWMISYVAWGAAALVPSMVSLTEPTQETPVRFTRLRLVLLLIAVLVPPVTLAAQHLRGDQVDVWTVVIATVALSALVIVRMGLAIDQIQSANLARDAAQGALAHQAAHDPLTGLPNRAQMLTLLRAAFNRNERTTGSIGLLLVDLDGLKQVNDGLGHLAGDEVLRIVGLRMQACVRTGDVVGRLGSDEFLVLLDPLDEEASAVAVADRLVAVVADPIQLDAGREVGVGASVGVAVAQGSRSTVDRLVNEAEVAVYRAKTAGRGRVEVYDRSLREEIDRRVALESALTSAISRRELTLRHEPIVDLATGFVVGHEALVDWPRPGADELDRAQVLPVAERSDLICDLDRWVLTEAAAQQAAVPAEHRAALLAVPVSGRHLLRPRLLLTNDVVAAFAASGLPLSLLVLLIREQDLIDDPRVVGQLADLRARGVRICLDGFGVNESPTTRWARLPVDLVRIDPAALAGGSIGSSMLLRITVETAHSFEWGVIAGGVGDPELLPVLAEAGCQFAQGPMSRRRRLARAGTAR